MRGYHQRNIHSKRNEAMIYCNLGRTQLAKKCDEFRVYKNNSGYFKGEELDLMMSGRESLLAKVVKGIK
jgi:hypothetical protein